ncbi:unnamed protein product [Nezara viridula]|uniref:Metalloendopeptidase n=1 Tax=Nezara viridula TaxID=85310 RepID=A0A9P0HU17_NEZVI|nr:unnamed protein product [Nezara viridula]
MLTSAVLLFVVAHALVEGRPNPGILFHDEEDLGVGDLLASFGEALFSIPDNKTGLAVANWNTSSPHNVEELGSYPEGDIIFPRPRARNGLKATSARWPGGRVPYVIGASFSSHDLSMIEAAIQEYHKRTCVRFVPRSSEMDYIVITSGPTGCWSSVGRIGGAQELNLQSPGCLVKKGTVMHEMMHALGFLHEQNRWERDQYVTVNFQNIQPGRESNFDKAKKSDTDSMGISYDYKSVMHYSANAFSSNGQPTIVPKQPGIELGQRDNASKQDIQKIRRMYRCKKVH